MFTSLCLTHGPLLSCVWLLLVATTAGNTLEGFGIVTLASLLPVLAVELMAVIIGAMWVALFKMARPACMATRTVTILSCMLSEDI